MVPYFTFVSPNDQKANVAASHELLLQSQSALHYYHSEMEFGGELYSFDDLYLVGWNPAIELNYHSPGAGTQANPPLAPELFGALAAARFFREDGQDQKWDGSERTLLHVTMRSNLERLTWEDLPSVLREAGEPSAKDGKFDVKQAYARWLRFCALWHFNYARAFSGDRPAGASDETWYRQILGDFRPDETQQGFADYVSSALRYAAAMSAYSKMAQRGRGVIVRSVGAPTDRFRRPDDQANESASASQTEERQTHRPAAGVCGSGAGDTTRFRVLRTFIGPFHRSRARAPQGCGFFCDSCTSIQAFAHNRGIER